ncbi:MAG TPA: LptF/LptG family permease [Phycisphaerales bacterium]|nr:LptF/LptG family permease [Phycisphaerales bacterium]
MRRRQPLKLWLYISLELWRLVFLTLGVLVVVLAFAVAIKPLADGKIGPVEALRFMALATVPMLQYALPFAAGFGATLAYHRLSADNEVIAAHASGVSHRSILAPALIAGTILAGVMVLLSQQMIPAFLKSMEQMITQDVAKVLVNSIERRQAVAFNDIRLFADSVVRVQPREDSGASDEFVLYRVCVLRVDDKGSVREDFTASQAHVWVMKPGTMPTLSNEGEDSIVVIVKIDDPIGNQPGRLFSRGESYVQPLFPGKSFKDDPKFHTYSDLRALREEPDRIDWIDSLRSELAARLITKRVSEEMQLQLAKSSRLVMLDGQGRRMTISASGMTWDGKRWDLEPQRSTDSIDIEIKREEKAARDATQAAVTRLSAPEASLTPSFRMSASPAERLVFELLVRDGVVRGLDSATNSREAAVASIPDRSYRDLTFPVGAFADLADKHKTPLKQLVHMVEQRVALTGPDPFLTDKKNELVNKVEKLDREIVSKQHERMAMAAACLVMVVTGAITAVQLSQSLPLTVYLWSFFPALAALITISTGQQVTHDKGLWGLIILWGGVGMLGVYGALGYARLARH